MDKKSQALALEAATAHGELDKLHIPRNDAEDRLSIWGRIQVMFRKDEQAKKIEECRSDLQRAREEINKGKKLLVDLYEKFPETRETISDRTGPWFAFGADRDELTGVDAMAAQAKPQENRMTRAERGWDALERLHRWAQAMNPKTQFSGDHPIAIARTALGLPETIEPPQPSPTNLVVGGKYNWKGQPDRLEFMGVKRYTGDARVWYQFAKVEQPDVVWSEVLGGDLASFEVTKP